MAQSTFNPSLDGTIRNNNADYATCWAASDGNLTATTGIVSSNWYNGTNYEIWRGIACFDTSSIPNDAIITSATVRFYTETLVDYASDSWVVVAYTGITTSIATSEFDQFGTTSYGSIAIGSMSLNANNTITLNTTGIAAISKTGTTKFGVRLQREIDQTSPTTGNNKSEVQAQSNSGANPPLLTVNYIVNEGNFIPFL